MHDMPTGKAAGTAMELIVRREAKAGVAQRFRVRRGDVRHSFEIVARRQCDIDLVVTASDRINGFSYGRTIYMTDGLMRYFSDDQDLAAVAAHFLGHVLLQHEADRDESKLAGQLDSLETAALDEGTRDERKKSGSLPGAQIYTEMQEIQADRAALELLAHLWAAFNGTRGEQRFIRVEIPLRKGAQELAGDNALFHVARTS